MMQVRQDESMTHVTLCNLKHLTFLFHMGHNPWFPVFAYIHLTYSICRLSRSLYNVERLVRQKGILCFSELLRSMTKCWYLTTWEWERAGEATIISPSTHWTPTYSLICISGSRHIFFLWWKERHQLAAKFNSVRSVDVQLACHRRLGSPLLLPPSPSLLPPKAPWLIMREGMQAQPGLRGVSINALQINKE